MNRRFLLLIFFLGWFVFSCKKNDLCNSCRENEYTAWQPPANCVDSLRNRINVRLVPFGNLSIARSSMSVAAAGGKILFAGGDINDGWGNGKIARVDIYDLVTQNWTMAELCAARYAIASATLDDKIFFAGGESFDGTWPLDSVDIYDAVSNSWSVSHLSLAGHSISATASGEKVFFAGGDGGFTGGNNRNKTVDIYDVSTNSWSFIQLGKGKGGTSAVAAKDKIYFAGGAGVEHDPSYKYKWVATDRIDIYDLNTDTWSVATMTEGKVNLAGIAVNDQIYWAGGITGDITGYPDPYGVTNRSYTSCMVEIKSLATGKSKIEYMSKPASLSDANVVLKENKIVFIRTGGVDADRLDIYDTTTGTWSVGLVDQQIPKHSSVIAVDNIIYIAGGYSNGVLTNQVWKLEF